MIEIGDLVKFEEDNDIIWSSSELPLTSCGIVLKIASQRQNFEVIFPEGHFTLCDFEILLVNKWYTSLDKGIYSDVIFK